MKAKEAEEKTESANSIQIVDAPAKSRKKTRDAEGSIIKRVVKRRTTGNKTKEVTLYYARVRYTDNSGKKREKKRLCDSYNDAVTKRRELQDEIKRELSEELEPPKPKSFSEVIDHYQKEYVKEAEYSGNQKVSGLREPIKYIERQLKLFRKEFGHLLIKRITYNDLKKFKEKRLAAPVEITYYEKIPLTEEEKKKAHFNKQFRYEKKKKTRPRAIASVHREMERLRRIFNIAVGQQWLEKSPFTMGDALISHSMETERVRILSANEEKRLLAECKDRREHLRAILICALDTCLRKNELFTLTWKDVDLDKNVISVQALNSKTGRYRKVQITSRLRLELEELKKVTFISGKDDRVFGIESSTKKAFYTAMKNAGITDFRFHDLRGTGITRLLRAGMPAAEVMKISGHTQWKTFMRYVKLDEDTIERSKTLLDNYLENLFPKENDLSA